MVKILPSITNISGEWRKKLKEAQRLNLKEVALFLSCSELPARRQIYRALEKSTIQRIPFVHARQDMDVWEYQYLMKRWKTKAFNLHSENRFAPIYDLTPVKDKIFLENNPGFKIIEKNVKKFGGLCVDFTHLEGDRLAFPKVYAHNIKMVRKYPRGCGHVSSVRPVKTYDPYSKIIRHDLHDLTKISELDYLKNYPLKLFPPYLAIELENPLSEQLVMKRYIKKILSAKGCSR